MQNAQNGYHKIDDFRAKLLGFLPLASATGIFRPCISTVKIHCREAILLWAFLAYCNRGLLIYELKDFKEYTIYLLGKWIEGRINEEIFT